MEKTFDATEFPARLGPVPFLGLALLSQTGMSFVQQGLVILGTFFVLAFHLNLTELGLITTALSLGVMVSMVFIGVAVDRRGPRMVLFLGALLSAAFSLLFLTVHMFAMLLLVLFLTGVSLAVVPSAGTKAVFTAFSGRPRGLVMGIRQTGVPIGAAVAAWLLPQLVPRFGLHPVYVVFAVELLITSMAFSAVMQPWNRVAAVSERKRLERRQWLTLLRPSTVAFLMVSGQYILLTYSIADLHQAHHLTLAMAGGILAISQIGGGLGRIVLGQVSDRLGGRRTPVITFAAVLGAVMAFVVGILPGTASLWVIAIVWVVFGFSAVGWNAIVLTWAGESVPSSHSGLAMSLIGSVVFLGSSVFPPVFGLIVDTTHRLVFGWWLLTGILLFAAILSWRAGHVQKSIS